MIHSPSLRTMRTAPIGPSNGRSVSVSAARGGIHAEHIGIQRAVAAHQHVVDLHFAMESIGKQRADRAVGDAHGEDFLLGRTRLALDVAARKTPGGIEFFAIFNLQREKITSLARFFRGGYGGENNVFANATGNGAMRPALPADRFRVSSAYRRLRIQLWLYPSYLNCALINFSEERTFPFCFSCFPPGFPAGTFRLHCVVFECL